MRLRSHIKIESIIKNVMGRDLKLSRINKPPCLHRYQKMCIWSIFLLLAVVNWTPAHAEVTPTVFKDQLASPNGITVGLDGSIFVHSKAGAGTALTKFAPNGTQLGQVALGSEFVGSRLATDPATGFLLLLTKSGQIWQVDPDTLQRNIFIDLRSLAGTVAQNVYDITAGQFRSLALGTPTYWDLAVRRVKNDLVDRLELFITGITGPEGGGGVFPFVLRSRFNLPQGNVENKVIVMSQNISTEAVNWPRGIAVNSEGTVSTTLPRANGEIMDFVVSFNANFPENNSPPPRFAPNFSDLPSWGMTSDATGNFYAATGVVGSSACGAERSGALVFIPKALNKFSCFSLGLGAVPVRSRDVAVSPVDGSVYVTVSDHNLVLRFPPLAGGGTDTVGLYNPADGLFFLRNSNTAGPADLVVRYGPAGAGWEPVVGDWNGDSADTVGLYNRADGLFFLRNSNTGGPADLVVRYGPVGTDWWPLVGDWNGDGTDTVGLYNPADGLFFLRNSNTAGPADLVVRYGPIGAGWEPVVGDWNGDGTDTVGLYNPTDGLFFLRNSNTGGPANLVVRYGPVGTNWWPLLRDWDNDGTDTVNLYNPADGLFFLRNSNTGGPADLVVRYGPTGTDWWPLAGDWDSK